jgi:hypothetical protein
MDAWMMKSCGCQRQRVTAPGLRCSKQPISGVQVNQRALEDPPSPPHPVSLQVALEKPTEPGSSLPLLKDLGSPLFGGSGAGGPAEASWYLASPKLGDSKRPSIGYRGTAVYCIDSHKESFCN